MSSTTPEPIFGHTNGMSILQPTAAQSLREVTVTNPEFRHTESPRSVTASEDYYSVASSQSDELAVPPPIKRYQTPPSRYRTPMASGDRLADISTIREQNMVPMRGPGRRRHHEHERMSWPNVLHSNPRKNTIARKPVPSTVPERHSEDNPRVSLSGANMSSAAKEIQRESSPPTPGFDDTAIIHFALDQLTRDEEVRGSRHYPAQPSESCRSGSRNSTRPSYVSMSPESFGDGPKHRSVAVPDAEAHIDPEVSDISRAASPVTLAEKHQAQTAALLSRNASRLSGRGDARPQAERLSLVDTFLALESTSDSTHVKLDALPALLRPLGLGAFILLLSLYLVALIIAAAWSAVHHQLGPYLAFADGRYFLFEYLPTLLGMALLMWLFEIVLAVHRVAPFIALSSDSPKSRSHAALLPLAPSTSVLPSLAHFQSGQPALAAFVLASWTALFTVPLLATAFNVYQLNGNWTWIATQGVIWVVVFLYTFLLASSLWLFAYLWKRPTNLKWDPTSLADVLVLLESSNVLESYASYFHNPSAKEFRENIVARGDRLGQWRTSTRPGAALHTIGAPGQPARQYRVENGRLVEKSQQRHSSASFDPASARYSHVTSWSLIHQSLETTTLPTRKPFLPWFLKAVVPIILSSTFLLLLLAFLVVSYLPTTAIRSGFVPALAIPVNTAGFSPANFLYSFVPSLLGLLLFLLWRDIDLTLRRLQPFANLSSPDGATPERSLLLSYTSDGPLLAPIKALVNHDYRLCLIGATALLSATLPVLAGGVFWAQFYVDAQAVRISADMPAFYALTLFVILAVLDLFALPFTAAQRMRYSIPQPTAHIASGETLARPRVNDASTLAGLIALTHQSRLLSDSAFRAPQTKTQLVARLLSYGGHEAASNRHSALLSSSATTSTTSLGNTAATAAAGPTVTPATRPAHQRAQASFLSLADSIRGFGDARTSVNESRRSSALVVPGCDVNAARREAMPPPHLTAAAAVAGGEMARFGLGVYTGRDGLSYVGIDRVGRLVVPHHDGKGEKTTGMVETV